jgi:hypothetical protein
MHSLGAVALFIQVEVLDGAFYDVMLVVGVEDDEVGFEGQVPGLAPQDAGTGGVEGTQGEAA